MIDFIYPTPILHKEADNNSKIKIQRELDKLCEGLSFVENAQWGAGHLQISDADGRSNVIVDHNLKSLSSYINLCVDEYVQECIGHTMKYNICQSWMTKTKHGQVAAVHNHSQFDIAGVYYYKTNMKDGAIKFSNPNLGLEASKTWMRSYTYNVRIQPNVGTLILFPAWLGHSVELNTTNDDRMSLAFNINIDRTMYNS
jgi:uncharacterized protein (TIGR02466 family)